MGLSCLIGEESTLCILCVWGSAVVGGMSAVNVLFFIVISIYLVCHSGINEHIHNFKNGKTLNCNISRHTYQIQYIVNM